MKKTFKNFNSSRTYACDYSRRRLDGISGQL